MKIYKHEAIATDRTTDLYGLAASAAYHPRRMKFANTDSPEKIAPLIKNLPSLNLPQAKWISVI